VAIWRGDDLGLAPQVVKIDVEGAENDVIAGLAATIRRSRPMPLVENSDRHSCHRLLAAHGYKPYRYEPDVGAIVPLPRGDDECLLPTGRAPARFSSNPSLESV
jgi:hypothetical protein